MIVLLCIVLNDYVLFFVFNSITIIMNCFYKCKNNKCYFAKEGEREA